MACFYGEHCKYSQSVKFLLLHSYKFRKKKDVPVLAYLIIDALFMILQAVAILALPIVVAAVACDGCDQAMTMAIILDIVLGIALGK